jgi:hypothetical protein
VVLCLIGVSCKPEPATTGAAAETVAAPASTSAMDGLPELPSGEIRGTLAVADAVKAQVAAGDVIFVMARNAATGTLIAVTRLEAPAQFPLAFELTAANVMHTKTSLAGKVRLEARVDKDRDAMTRNPGDVVGDLPDLVAVPAESVVLTLSHAL